MKGICRSKNLSINAYMEVDYPINTEVVMVGEPEYKVSIAGKGSYSLGYVQSNPRNALPGMGSVMTKFSLQLDVDLASPVSVGDYVKLSDPNMETLANRYEKWVPGTDCVGLQSGYVIKCTAQRARILVP